MGTEIRTIEPGELVAWLEAMHVGFLVQRSAEEEAARRGPVMELDRTLGAFRSGRLVGTLRTFASSLTLPGPVPIPVEALTNVTVSPLHRREGVLRSLIAEARCAAIERGDALSMLIASEYPIYERFGYGPGTRNVALTVDTTRTRFVAPGAGTLEMLPPAEMVPIAAEVYEQVRQRTVGAVGVLPHWWEERFGLGPEGVAASWDGRGVVCRDARGRVSGYVRYRVTDGWDGRDPDATVEIDDLYALDDASYARLWRHCCEIDLVRTVRAGDRSVDERLPWLLEDARAVRRTHESDFLWLRVLDPVTVLGARRYPEGTAFTVRVVDPDGPADGTFAVEGGPDGASCRKVRRKADVTLPVSALGAVVLGGTRLTTLAGAGRAEATNPATLTRVAQALATADAPWTDVWF